MTFYIYLFFSVIVVGCIFSINLFLEKKKFKKKKKRIEHFKVGNKEHAISSSKTTCNIIPSYAEHP